MYGIIPIHEGQNAQLQLTNAPILLSQRLRFMVVTSEFLATAIIFAILITFPFQSAVNFGKQPFGHAELQGSYKYRIKNMS